MQGQYYIVCVLKTSAMQVKIEYVLCCLFSPPLLPILDDNNDNGLNKSKKPQSRYRELVASSSDRTGGESSDPTDGIINFVTDSEDDRAFSSPSPAPTQSDAGFQVDIPRGVTQKFSTSNKHIIHAQIEERNERKGIDVMAVH